MSIFDFDHDGSVEPWEVGLGASLIGFGGLALDAEEKADKKRQEYEDALDEKQARIDELEDEIEDLRDSLYCGDSYDEDSLNDSDDHEDDDDRMSDDTSDDDERDPYDVDENYRRLFPYMRKNGEFDYAQALLDGAFEPFGEGAEPAFVVFCFRSWMKKQKKRKR